VNAIFHEPDHGSMASWSHAACRLRTGGPRWAAGSTIRRKRGADRHGELRGRLRALRGRRRAVRTVLRRLPRTRSGGRGDGARPTGVRHRPRSIRLHPHVPGGRPACEQDGGAARAGGVHSPGEAARHGCRGIAEILHRYAAIRRRDAIQPAFDAGLGVVDDVYPVEQRKWSARTVLLGNDRLSARDVLRIAAMEQRGVTAILTFDAGFDGIARRAFTSPLRRCQLPHRSRRHRRARPLPRSGTFGFDPCLQRTEREASLRSIA
jgi:hypothetical protein